ncbi:MAG: hypothetical protein AAB229_02335 [Candidatus Hydrogenedentota bacterium]
MSFKPAVSSIIGKKISGVVYLSVDGGRRHSLILTFEDDSHIEFYSYAHIHGLCGAYDGGFDQVLADSMKERAQSIEFAVPKPDYELRPDILLQA